MDLKLYYRDNCSFFNNCEIQIMQIQLYNNLNQVKLRIVYNLY